MKINISYKNMDKRQRQKKKLEKFRKYQQINIKKRRII